MIYNLGIEAIQWEISNDSYVASIDGVFLGLVDFNEGWFVCMKPRGGGIIVFRGIDSLPEALLGLERAYEKNLSHFQWDYLYGLAGSYSVN